MTNPIIKNPQSIWKPCLELLFSKMATAVPVGVNTVVEVLAGVIDPPGVGLGGGVTSESPIWASSVLNISRTAVGEGPGVGVRVGVSPRSGGVVAPGSG